MLGYGEIKIRKIDTGYPMSLVKVYMTGFFIICSIKSPQCAGMYRKEKISIAIFLSRLLIYQKREISLPVVYKTARPKQETGNDCDVISGFKLREKQISQSFSYC